MHKWKDSGSYKKKRTRAEWAWEFMRRNANYHADYAMLAKAWSEVPRQGHVYLGPKSVEVERLGLSLGIKWGQLGPPRNPDSNGVPRFVLSGPVMPDGDDVNLFYEDVGSTVAQQRREFATLTFDVRRPIKPQVRRAHSYLKGRKTKVTSINPVRSSEQWWPAYLRVLDAKLAGAKNSEIAAEISSIKVLKEKYEASKRVSEYYKRARRLRDNPLMILL